MKMRPKGQPIGLSILIAGIASFITSAQIDPSTARVERVMDGDTVRVGFEGKGYTVRLIGVDTPETKHPTQAVEYFGREASAFTKAHLEGKTVALGEIAPGIPGTAAVAGFATSTWTETTSTPGSSARATLTPTEGLPSQNGRSLST